MKQLIGLLTIQLTFGLMGLHTVQAQCFGGFTDSIDSTTVHITNQATGSYNYIEYDFGDGNWVGNVPNPVHTYAEEGIYQVCQFIMDTLTFQCFDNYCETIYIGDATCQAQFWWFPNGLQVEFFANLLGTYDSVLFDFGDFNTSNDTMPIHTYAAPGAYTVCLTLFDSSGSICDSICQTIFVDSASCVADFDYDADGLDVDFTNLSTGNYNAVSWDFGDGFGFSNDNDPSYTYFLAGSYEVCLFIYDTLSGSCFSQVCMEVTVTTGGGGGGECNANFDYTQQELEVTFENTSTGNYLTAFWDFGDGSNPSLDPFYTYEEPGTYEVCLTIGNFFPFCFDQYCEMVTVTQFNCEPAFDYSYNPISNVFSFTNATTVGNVTSVKWEFGDGNTTTFANPSYTYNLPGTYTVCLNTYDGDNLCGVICKEVEVYPLGAGSLDASSTKIYPNPSAGEFVLDRGTASGMAQVILTDLSGRELHRHISNQRLISLNYQVATGAYLLQVRDEFGRLEVLRVVVE